MVMDHEFSRWMLDVLRWSKYVQLFPEGSYTSVNTEEIIIVYGQKTLGVSPFSIWKPYYDQGISPESAVEMFIHNEK
jgi:hypothetical protein